MNLRAAVLLACSLVGACAGSRAHAPAARTPRIDSAQIVLRHADAIEVAETLDRLIESAYRKTIGGSCALPFPSSRLVSLPERPWKHEAMTRTASVAADCADREPTAAGAGSERDRHLAQRAWRHRLSVSGIREPYPRSLIALDRRTLVVLHPERAEGYFERIRGYVAELDRAAEDDG